MTGLMQERAGRMPSPRASRRRLTKVDPQRFGPWAVVTGASSGIGLEFARQLAAAGLNIVLVSRRRTVLEEIGAELSHDFGIEHRVVAADLSTEEAPQVIAEATADLDVGLLISNAGTGQPGNFLAFSESDLRGIAQLNAISYMMLTHHFGRRLVARGRGGVLLVSAMGADEGIPFSAKEAATKALVSTLGRGLHVEFERLGLGLTVLVVSPTDTPIIDKMGFARSAMPLKPMPAERCVREALAALGANRASIMPGRLYRIMNRLMPASLSRRMTATMMLKSSTFVT
jgi:uncharacterized protein